MANLLGQSADAANAGVKGEYTGTGPTYVHDGGKGVQGISQNGYGVQGISVVGRGVVAESDTNYGLRASSRTLAAARCSSSEGTGVEGEAGGKGDGVRGSSKSGTGAVGISDTGRGVAGFSNTWQGVYGHSNVQAGVVGESDQFDGVYGVSHNKVHAGVSGHNLDRNGKPVPGGMAGFFNGDLIVTGDIQVNGDIKLMNADLAEDFDVTEDTEAGDVMVLTETGMLEPSTKPYDKKAIGVISGAGEYKPAIILDKQTGDTHRKPVAMMGKVYCKVDAGIAPIDAGDLLTTSHIRGYAMKAADPLQAFGAVIGKALRSAKNGKGLIPILVILK